MITIFSILLICFINFIGGAPEKWCLNKCNKMLRMTKFAASPNMCVYIMERILV